MTDESNYVACGQNLAELQPTPELRWDIRFVPMPGRPEIGEAKQVLQQKWVASAKMADGGTWSEHRWRDVPTHPNGDRQ